jgi:predicted aconitase with swiveling domain
LSLASRGAGQRAGRGEGQIPPSCALSALTDRLNDGYKAAIALVDTNHDGIVLSGTIVTEFPVVAASQGEDSDDR